MEYYHSARLTHMCVCVCVCMLDEGQERILLAILLNYTREEFNLVERRECACIEKKNERKERVLIAARGRQ